MFTIENPTREEYEYLVSTGDFHPDFSFEDYLEICRERRELRAEAEREGWLDGYEEPPDLDDPETMRILGELVVEMKARWAAQRQEAA